MSPDRLSQAVLSATEDVLTAHGLDISAIPGKVPLVRPRRGEHGDYASPWALRVATRVGMAPRDLADALATRLRRIAGITSVTVAGPGFLNVTLAPEALGERARAAARLGRQPVRVGPEVDLTAVPARVPSGLVVTMANLVEVIGLDAARYAATRHRGDPPVEIDVDRWTRATPDNPIHYVQYAHARLASWGRHAAALGIATGDDEADPGRLTHGTERVLLATVGEFPEVAATTVGPAHRMTAYCERLVEAVHHFEDSRQILPQGDEPVTDLIRARLWLVGTARTVLASGLAWLGVTAPERM